MRNFDHGAEFEAGRNQIGIELLRPTRMAEALRAGERVFKPLRQCVESIFDTFKGQLNMEQHGGRTVAGARALVCQRVLALTAAIWHNAAIGAPPWRPCRISGLCQGARGLTSFRDSHPDVHIMKRPAMAFAGRGQPAIWRLVFMEVSDCGEVRGSS